MMIRLTNTSEVQKFAVTLTEMSSISNPVYLFVFTNEMTKDVLTTFLTDLSTNKQRYNLFELAGNFFPSTGWYSYSVYEKVDESNTDQPAASLLESGKLLLAEVDGSIYNQNQSTTNFKEYAG